MHDQKQSKTRVIGFRASPDTVELIEAVATAGGWTVAHVAREIVEMSLAGRMVYQPQQEAA